MESKLRGSGKGMYVCRTKCIAKIFQRIYVYQLKSDLNVKCHLSMCENVWDE